MNSHDDHEQDRERWVRALTRHAGRPWRSLGDLLDDPAFRAEVGPEFPIAADAPPDEVSRRNFIKLLGASMAMAGAAGCTRAPKERIVPYTTQPPEVTPGIASHYATALTHEGYGVGVIVESHEGRPTKLEGNPHHPASLGAADAIAQASVLALYDPSRARAIHQRGVQRGWRALFEAFGAEQRAYSGSARGEGLHLLMEPSTSPLVEALLARVRGRYPRAEVHYASATSRTAAWQATAALFGRPLDVQHDLGEADVVVALDSDLLDEGPYQLRYARDFARRRKVRAAHDEMNRLYVFESHVSTTGAMADHRLRVRRADVPAVAAALLAAVLDADPIGAAAPVRAALDPLRAGAPHGAAIAALARDLRAHRGRVAIFAGDGQPAVVHAIAHMLEAALGAAGASSWLTASATLEAGEASHDRGRLLAALDANAVDTLVVLDGNPAYSMPADLEFPRRMRLARERVYLGLYENETARESTWFVSAAHFLERWGMARAYDGTASIVQPLIAPLYEGRTPADLLAALSGDAVPDAHARLREVVGRGRAAPDAQNDWERWLQRGVIDDTASPRVPATLDWAAGAKLLADARPASSGLELAFVCDPRVHDGAHTNNAWLLELPEPVTKLTWENAALLSPATATRLGVSTGDVVELTLRGRTTTAPVFVLPGHADDSVSLSLGWGRSGAEQLARGLGANAYLLQPSASPGFGVGVAVRATGLSRKLATTQEHWSLEGRDHLRHATLDEYRAEPLFAKGDREPRTKLYKLPLVGDPQWSMAIDLNACTGCSACVVACQAENNIPTVGREGVLMSREMHWLRIDRYFDGPVDAPEVLVQPMLCQHCEQAPCEYVCPVNATVHGPDGINEQVYNRCVGTRFCSNNCAWKVRRFNWFNYHEQAMKFAPPDQRDLHDMVMNPDVTVRARGVMEKCTFCVQRVREAEIKARIGDGPILPDAFTSACAQACPSEAIVFGSIGWGKDHELNVRRDNDRSYGALEELGTEPRVRYLAKLRNPNPEIEGAAGKAEGGKP